MSKLLTKSINFTNPFKDYVGKYGGEEYELPGGESLFLPAHLACHFAKHLSDRELHTMEPEKEVTDPLKHELVKKISPLLRWKAEGHSVEAVSGKGMVESSQLKESVDALNKDEVSDPASEVGPVKEPEEEVPEVGKELSRQELNEEAVELGVDEKKVLAAPNKKAVKELIEAAK